MNMILNIAGGDRSMYQNKHNVRYEWIRKGTNEAKGNHLDIDRTTLAMRHNYNRHMHDCLQTEGLS